MQGPSSMPKVFFYAAFHFNVERPSMRGASSGRVAFFNAGRLFYAGHLFNAGSLCKEGRLVHFGFIFQSGVNAGCLFNSAALFNAGSLSPMLKV